MYAAKLAEMKFVGKRLNPVIFSNLATANWFVAQKEKNKSSSCKLLLVRKNASQTLKPYPMTAFQFQSALIELLRRQTPKEKNLADELAVILNLNKNAVYKRLSGTTPFSLEDLVLLAQHYQLPMHTLFHPDSDFFTAEFSGFTAKTTPLEYLRLLEQEMEALRAASGPQVWCVTTGLPDFYYFYFEELTLFKFFIWERMVWNNPAWQERKFSLDMPEKAELLPLSKRLSHHYSHIPTTEIWNENVLDSLLHQVFYVVENRLFEKTADIAAVMNCLETLVSHLEKIAGDGKRYPPGGSPAGGAARFQLFYNEIMPHNIFLLVETEEDAVVYSVLDNPNFLKTSSPAVVSYVKALFEKLLRRAIPLGKKGEKLRQAYFHKLNSRLTYFEQQITALMTTGSIAQPVW